LTNTGKISRLRLGMTTRQRIRHLDRRERSFLTCIITLIFVRSPLQLSRPDGCATGSIARRHPSACVPVALTCLVKLYFLGKHVHVHSVIPPDSDQMTIEVVDLAFDRAARVHADKSLMSSDAAFCKTTLSRAWLRHFRSFPPVIPNSALWQEGCQSEIHARSNTCAADPAPSCHRYGTKRSCEHSRGWD